MIKKQENSLKQEGRITFAFPLAIYALIKSIKP